MNIVQSEKEYVNFKDIAIGEVFRVHIDDKEEYCMKTKTIVDYNAVLLEDGDLIRFCDTTSVERINAELVIK